jgi:hypothetical protein
MKAKPPVPFYYWPLWMACLALGLFVFYVLLTPVWMGIRLIAWIAERRNLESSSPAAPTERSGGSLAKDASEENRHSP